MLVVTREIEVSYIGVFKHNKPIKAGPDTLVADKAYFLHRANGRVDNSRISADLPRFQDESGIKDEDIPFARLVVLTNGLLVTYDGPLRERIPANSAIPAQAKQSLI